MKISTPDRPFLLSPCPLGLSVPGTLATIMASLLHCFLSVITSLSSAIFIPVTSCVSSIRLLLGRPLLLLLPSPHTSIIPFSNSSDRITSPKIPSFLHSYYNVAKCVLIESFLCLYYILLYGICEFI